MSLVDIWTSTKFILVLLFLFGSALYKGFHRCFKCLGLLCFSFLATSLIILRFCLVMLDNFSMVLEPTLWWAQFTLSKIRFDMWKMLSGLTTTVLLGWTGFSTQLSGGKLFRNIRQQISHRVISNHKPVILQCGDWEQRKSYFKFENWWLNVQSFKDLIQNWWNGFVVEGCPDFKVSLKLKMLKAETRRMELCNCWGTHQQEKQFTEWAS